MAAVADFMVEAASAAASTAVEVGFTAVLFMAADIMAGERMPTAVTAAAGTTATVGITVAVDTMAAGGMADAVGMEAAAGTAAGATPTGVGVSDGAGLTTGAGATRMATGDTRPIIIPTRAERRMTIPAAIRTRIRILILARQDISASRTGTGTLHKVSRLPIRQGIQDPT